MGAPHPTTPDGQGTAWPCLPQAGLLIQAQPGAPARWPTHKGHECPSMGSSCPPPILHLRLPGPPTAGGLCPHLRTPPHREPCLPARQPSTPMSEDTLGQQCSSPGLWYTTPGAMLGTDPTRAQEGTPGNSDVAAVMAMPRVLYHCLQISSTLPSAPVSFSPISPLPAL